MLCVLVITLFFNMRKFYYDTECKIDKTIVINIFNLKEWVWKIISKNVNYQIHYDRVYLIQLLYSSVLQFVLNFFLPQTRWRAQIVWWAQILHESSNIMDCELSLHNMIDEQVLEFTSRGLLYITGQLYLSLSKMVLAWKIRPFDLGERSKPDSGIKWVFMKATDICFFFQHSNDKHKQFNGFLIGISDLWFWVIDWSTSEERSTEGMSHNMHFFNDKET